MRFQSFYNLVSKFSQLKHTFKVTVVLKKHCSVERVKGDTLSKNVQLTLNFFSNIRNKFQRIKIYVYRKKIRTNIYEIK